MTASPTDREQVEFLTKLQRLLGEGEFVATYKFALLLALADVAIEKGDDSGAPMHVALTDIAEKFIRLYWRQSAPHPGGTILKQNTGAQAEIIGHLVAARAKQPSFAKLTRDAKAWRSLTSKVASVVRKMPLLKLQTLGGAPVEFLYPNVVVNKGIELRPGVAFCLRRFHGLIEDLVRGAWLRFVRRLPANQPLIGEATDLSAFMFGSERDDLGAFVPILRDLQMDACFYCGATLRNRKLAVDHFIPWSSYPNDLGHNFVLVDETCNSNKSDALAGLRHLDAWWRRLDDHGPALGAEFDGLGIVHDAAASRRVTTWAYANAEHASARLWVTSDEFEPIEASWRSIASA